MVLHLIKEVRDINRFNQILAVLFEEGFDFLLSRINLGHHVPITKKLTSKLKKGEWRKPEVMLRNALERLGPTFIKFGQLLSVRPDLIPKEYCKELEKLQDSVPEFPFKEVESIIEHELGKPINHIFLHFEKKPIAAASISQVHKAVLKNGQKVAVKIQRPNVRQLMETDIEIMFYVANLLEKHMENIKRFKPVRIVSEFREWTEKELDFRLEARNAKRFYENFKGSTKVKIPKVYDDFSTERVLTLEFIDGIDINNFNEIRKRKLDTKQIMQNWFESTLVQVYSHGVFHADPHPGNMIVISNSKIAFVDFGIVGYFDEKLKGQCVDMMHGIISQDPEIILDTLTEMGMESDSFDYGELESEIGLIISPLQNASVKDVKPSKILEQVLDVAITHKLRVPTPLVLFAKTLVTLEGVALEYEPDFRVVEATKPFIERLMLKRASPLYVWKTFVHTMHRYRRLAENFPQRAERALDKIEKGTFKVDIEDTDIKRLSLELDRSSNRVAYGMLIAAFLITSAILIQVERGPNVLGVPILSFISFVFALLLMFILSMSIVREKFRHW